VKFPIVPITFTWRGKNYRGILEVPNGAGGSSWHLTINNYHFGGLVSTLQGWRFFSNSGYFEDLGDFFADYITAYLDGPDVAFPGAAE
jgi:hypothetical protein